MAPFRHPRTCLHVSGAGGSPPVVWLAAGEMEGVAVGRDRRVLNLGLGRFLNLTKFLRAFSPGDLNISRENNWEGYMYLS